jgi:hypothetical protein
MKANLHSGLSSMHLQVCREEENWIGTWLPFLQFIFIMCVQYVFNPRRFSFINMYDCHANQMTPNKYLGFCFFHPLRRQVYFIPIVGLHLWHGEQVFRTIVLIDPTSRGRIRFLEAFYTTARSLHQIHHHDSSSSWSDSCLPSSSITHIVIKT